MRSRTVPRNCFHIACVKFSRESSSSRSALFTLRSRVSPTSSRISRVKRCEGAQSFFTITVFVPNTVFDSHVKWTLWCDGLSLWPLASGLLFEQETDSQPSPLTTVLRVLLKQH